MKQSIDDIKQKIVPILREAGIKKAALFGSVARGENTEKSDVDILFDPPEGMGLFQYSGLALSLEDRLGKKVDLVTYGSLKPTIKPYIESDMINIL